MRPRTASFHTRSTATCWLENFSLTSKEESEESTIAASGIEHPFRCAITVCSNPVMRKKMSRMHP